MKPFTKIAVLIFVMICAVHIIRLLFGWEARIGGFDIPQWISVVGLLLAGLMAIMLWKENK